MENVVDRIQKTAIREIGSKVICDQEPVVVRNSLIMAERLGLVKQLERANEVKGDAIKLDVRYTYIGVK